MGRLISFILFFTIFSGILFGIHFFIFRVISKNILISEKVLSWIKWWFIFSGISIVAGQLLSRFLSIHLVKNYGFIWLGFVSITFAIFIAASVVKIIRPGGSRYIISIALVISISITIFSLLNYYRGPAIKIIKITTRKNIGDINDFRIAHLSDLHLDNASSLGEIKNIVKMSNSFSPHLIVITGDLVDGPLEESDGIDEILRGFKAEFGVYAVTGNHEYYSGIDNFKELADRANIKIISDSHVVLNRSFSLYGMSDISSVKTKNNKTGSTELLKDLNREHFNIFIGHRPYGFETNAGMGIDLQLAGHTHAGQIPPMDLIVQMVYKYPVGLYRENDSFIYTTSGTGVWGPPMRFLSRSEIVLIKIRHDNSVSGIISGRK